MSQADAALRREMQRRLAEAAGVISVKGGDKIAPPLVVQLPADAFSPEYERRPGRDLLVGLRLVSDETTDTARSEASRLATRMHSPVDDPGGWLDAHNEALIRFVLARALTLPDDVSKLYFECAEETIKIALTTRGVQLLWERYQELEVQLSPLSPEASDEEASRLVELLAGADGSEAKAVRRLVRRCLDRLEALPR